MFCCACTSKMNLKDIANPHFGVYECTQVSLGEVDYMDEFSRLALELAQDDVFYLYFANKEGQIKRAQGKYSYDRECGELTLMAEKNNCLKRKVPLKEGIITIQVPFGMQTLSIIFERK